MRRSRNEQARLHAIRTRSEDAGDPEILTRRTKATAEWLRGITKCPNHRFLRSVEVASRNPLRDRIVFFDPTCKGFGDSGRAPRSKSSSDSAAGTIRFKIDWQLATERSFQQDRVGMPFHAVLWFQESRFAHAGAEKEQSIHALHRKSKAGLKERLFKNFRLSSQSTLLSGTLPAYDHAHYVISRTDLGAVSFSSATWG